MNYSHIQKTHQVFTAVQIDPPSEAIQKWRGKKENKENMVRNKLKGGGSEKREVKSTGQGTLQSSLHSGHTARLSRQFTQWDSANPQTTSVRSRELWR